MNQRGNLMKGLFVLKEEKGVVFVVTLLLLLILTLIGINAINSSVFETKLSGNERVRNIAFYAAEGGIGAGLDQLPTLTAYSGMIGSDGVYRSGALNDSSPQPLKDLGLINKSGFEGTWEFKRFQINATGESLGARKEIEVQVVFGPYPSGTSYNN